MKKIIGILVVLFAAAYTALWYLNCAWLARQAVSREGEFNFGEVKMKIKVAVEQQGYGGFFRGRSAVLVKVKETKVAATIKAAGQPEFTTETEFLPNEKDLVYEMSAPVFGSSVGFKILGDLKVDYINRQPGKEIKTTFTGKGGGAWAKFRNFNLLFLREDVWNEQLDFRKFVDSYASLEVEPYETAIYAEGSPNPIMSGKSGRTEVAWKVADDGMFVVDGYVDTVASYGKGFMETMAVRPPNSQSLPEHFELGKEIFEAAFTEGKAAIFRGKFGFALPAKLIGLSDTPPSRPGFQEVPPFSFYAKDFEVTFPVFLEGQRILNVDGAFMYGEGAPIKFSINQTVGPIDHTALYDKVLSILKSRDPAIAAQFDQIRPGEVKTLKELEGTVGAMLMVRSGFKVYNDIALAGGKTELDLNIKTDTGNFSPFDMFGAKSDFNFLTSLGDITAIKGSGTVTGTKSFEVKAALERPGSLLKLVSPVFRDFCVRSLAQILMGDPATTPPLGPDIEQKLIQFFYSDQLQNRVVDTLLRVAAVADGEPASADSIEAKIEGGTNGVLINGKPAAEMAAVLEQRTLDEGKTFMAYLKTELTAISPAAGDRLPPLPGFN